MTMTGNTATLAAATREARRLTDKTKGAYDKWLKDVLRLYDMGAPALLGYASWAEYCAEEFAIGKTAAYQFLNAARVVETLSDSATANCEVPQTESQARELVSLLDEPEMLRKVWTAACSTAAAQKRSVTADLVRETKRVLTTPAFTPAPPETDDRSKVTELRPRPAAEQDSRFEQIGDAVAMLESLPKPDAIVFPTSPGDMQSLDASLQWLSEWLPEVKRAWREHRKALSGRQVG